MNDNAKLWVAGLRSGDYKQGKGVLRSVDDKYCCLGVACELAIEAGVPVKRERTDGLVYQYDGQRYYLPTSVMEWLGLNTRGGRALVPLVWKYTADGVAEMNDNDATFAEIADAIEREPEGMFY